MSPRPSLNVFSLRESSHTAIRRALAFRVFTVQRVQSLSACVANAMLRGCITGSSGAFSSFHSTFIRLAVKAQSCTKICSSVQLSTWNAPETIVCANLGAKACFIKRAAFLLRGFSERFSPFSRQSLIRHTI